MINVIGVRFRTAGKMYFFSPGQFAVKQGDYVIVETARGVEYGRVVSGPKEVSDDSVVQPLKSVIRIATDEDKRTVEENHQKEKEAFKICQEKIRKHDLDMKLIDAEYTFDNNKVLFYFTADGRIDFRELVKDLAAVFRTRIELRQIISALGLGWQVDEKEKLHFDATDALQQPLQYAQAMNNETDGSQQTDETQESQEGK